MAFLDLTFPREIAAGVVGGPQRRVDIVTLSGGEEERNARWVHSRRSFDAAMGVKSADVLEQVVAFFEEVGGPLHSFRFRDWSDFSSSSIRAAAPGAMDQVLGVGDGTQTQFQLSKTYGQVAPYVRPITKPIAATVKVGVSGVALSSGWSVAPLSGLITFSTPPASGAEITAGFLFDVPVRFDAPQLFVDMAFFSEDEGRGVGTVPEIPLIEVRE